MEIEQYLNIIRKWGWLILLVACVAGIGSYVYSTRITPTYRAETTLLVGQQQQNPNGPVDTSPNSDLAGAYASLVVQPNILEATANAVQYPGGWQALYFKVAANASGNQLIRITAA